MFRLYHDYIREGKCTSFRISRPIMAYCLFNGLVLLRNKKVVNTMLFDCNTTLPLRKHVKQMTYGSSSRNFRQFSHAKTKSVKKFARMFDFG